jgi:hypothetical protein
MMKQRKKPISLMALALILAVSLAMPMEAAAWSEGSWATDCGCSIDSVVIQVGNYTCAGGSAQAQYAGAHTDGNDFTFTVSKFQYTADTDTRHDGVNRNGGDEPGAEALHTVHVKYSTDDSSYNDLLAANHNQYDLYMSAVQGSTFTINNLTTSSTHDLYLHFYLVDRETVTEKKMHLVLENPQAPSFTTQPQDSAVVAGNSATFTVAANGKPAPTLQWQRSTDNGASWTDIPGETGATLTLTAATPGDNGNRYRCMASNTQTANVPSGVATLTVRQYGLSLTPAGNHAFPDVSTGYGAQTPHSVTVNNTGNQATGNLKVSLSGTGASGFTLTGDSIPGIQPGSTAGFTVAPAGGLAEGVYTATVTIGPDTGNTNPIAPTSFDVSLRVLRAEGNISVVVESSADAPDIKLVDPDSLKDIALTQGEKDEVASNPNVSYVLTLKTSLATDTDSADSRLADEKADEEGYDVDLQLDIQLVKERYLNDSLTNSAPVTSLPEDISIVMTIPTELRQAQNTFAMIRVHEGTATILPDMDDNSATITVDTNLFSTYALVHDEAAANTSDSSSKTGNPPTGDGGRALWLALASISLALVAISGGIRAARKKRDAAK